MRIYLCSILISVKWAMVVFILLQFLLAASVLKRDDPLGSEWLSGLGRPITGVIFGVWGCNIHVHYALRWSVLAVLSLLVWTDFKSEVPPIVDLLDLRLS